MKPITWQIMFPRTPLSTCELKLPFLLDGLEIFVMCCLLILEVLIQMTSLKTPQVFCHATTTAIKIHFSSARAQQ